jgi:hypothetical protein
MMIDRKGCLIMLGGLAVAALCVYAIALMIGGWLS